VLATGSGAFAKDDSEAEADSMARPWASMDPERLFALDSTACIAPRASVEVRLFRGSTTGGTGAACRGTGGAIGSIDADAASRGAVGGTDSSADLDSSRL
jgi:hypothetical protein